MRACDQQCTSPRSSSPNLIDNRGPTRLRREAAQHRCNPSAFEVRDLLCEQLSHSRHYHGRTGRPDIAWVCSRSSARMACFLRASFDVRGWVQRNDRPCAHLSYGLVDLQQCGEAFADFIKQFGGSDGSHSDVSLLPGDTAHLVHQNDARNRVAVWNGNFKRITSGAAGNWTNDTVTRSCIVLPRCQHNRWTMTALLVANRGI